MKSQNIGFLQLVVAGILSSFIPLIIRFDENLGAYNLAFFRIFVAAIILGVYFLIFRNRLSKPLYEKRKLILFGAIHAFILVGYFFAIKILTIASAVLLMYTFPFWMIPLSYFMLGEKINKKNFGALVISFIGIVVLINPEGFFGGEFLGYLFGLGAGFGAGLVYIISKTFKKYNEISLTFWQNLIAIPFVLPFLFIKFPRNISAMDLFIILVLGILAVISFILVYKGFRKVSANKGGVIMLLHLLFPIILAMIIFAEFPDIRTTIGGILIILGVLISKE